MATHAQREHVVRFLDFCHAHAAGLLYPPADIRTGFDLVSWHMSEQHMEHVLEAGGKWQGDCSEFGAYALKVAGLWRWPQPGATRSHLTLLPDHYTDGKRARPGALVVCGLDRDPNGLHELIVHTADPKGGNPIVASHGRAGYDHGRVSDFAVGELSGHVYLSIAHL